MKGQPQRRITYRGRTQSIPAWAKELGVPDSTLRSRLAKPGATVEEAMAIPPAAPMRRVGPVVETREPPKLIRHSKGTACCRWSVGGRRQTRYFGAYGSAEAGSAYSRFCAEWWASQGNPPPVAGEGVAVAELGGRFYAWAKDYYRKDGKRTSEVGIVRSAVRALNKVYGDTDVADFGPVQLRALQAGWVKDGLSMGTVNGYVSRVCRCFSWGVGRGLMPAAIADALAHVESLARGRTVAPVYAKVEAAPEADIAAALPYLHTRPDRCAVLAAMVRLQRLTGMRPGEVCELAAEDIDRSREPWLYRPASGGKTIHLMKRRSIFFGPKARAELEPLLARAEPDKPLFRMARLSGKGSVSVTGRFYGLCLAAACKRAGVPIIRPNQIRHSFATELFRTYEDVPAVAALLGNSPAMAEAVYIDDAKEAVARRIAESVG